MDIFPNTASELSGFKEALCSICGGAPLGEGRHCAACVEAMRDYAWEMRRSALARFSSEELARELKERSNRRVLEFNTARARAPREGEEG